MTLLLLQVDLNRTGVASISSVYKGKGLRMSILEPEQIVHAPQKCPLR